jgi:hypothetical protein
MAVSSKADQMEEDMKENSLKISLMMIQEGQEY